MVSQQQETDRLNQTPSGERTHIGFFGCTNAGKSSLINALTSQEVALVSEKKGTTTDPVKKAMEILPLGPVVLIDTPGLDDHSELGEQRARRTAQVLSETDLAVLVVDAARPSALTALERKLVQQFQKRGLPYILVLNKCEMLSQQQKASLLREAETELALQDTQVMFVSSQTGENINKLRERLGHMTPAQAEEVPLIQDKIAPGDTVILVIPIDSSAPKGRLILPQQQTIREILEAGAMAYALQETELSQALANLKKRPKLVITDSQVFHRIKDIVPRDIYLTSFSMLFARKKGDLPFMAENAACLGTLPSGSRILISEGCTHHRQCEDIGTVKLPKWIQEFTGKSFQFDFTSGGNFPEDISQYGLIVHCGGCMLNRREVQSRLEQARVAGVPMTNYGVLIAYMQGILERSMEIFNTNQSISANEKQGITGIEG